MFLRFSDTSMIFRRTFFMLGCVALVIFFQPGRTVLAQSSVIKSTDGKTIPILDEEGDSFIVDMSGQRTKVQKPEGWEDMVALFKKAQRAEETIALYEENRRKRPNDAAYDEQLGDFLLSIGRHSRAFDAFHEAVTKDPKNGKLRNKEAFELLRLGRYDEALNTLKIASEVMPMEQDIWNHLGDSYVFLSQMDQALEAYRRAVSLSGPDTERIALKLSRLQRNKDMLLTNDGERKKFIWASQSLDPRFDVSHMLYADFRKQNDEPALIARAKDEISLDQNNESAYETLGDAHERLRDYGTAIDYYMRTLKINPASRGALSGLSASYLQLEDLDNGGHYAQELLQCHPDSHEGHRYLAIIHKARENYPLAIAHYKRAIELMPDYADAHKQLARLLFDLKDYYGSLQHFEGYLQLRPNDAQAHSDVGAVYFYAGDKKRARQHLQKALQIDANLQSAKDNLRKV